MQLFARYSCQWVRKSLGLDFKQFVDTLNVFATGTGAELILRYPGPNDELICEYALHLRQYCYRDQNNTGHTSH